jgi:hypothetical protein
MRKPFAQPVAYVASFLLASAMITGAVHLWDARHDNSVVSSTSHERSGALVVSGQGVTLTFPPGEGWLNVPVTPNQMARFLSAEEKKFPWLRSQLSQSQMSLIQLTRNEAMLVYRIQADVLTATCNVSVAAGTTSPGELVSLLREHLADISALHPHVTPLDFGGRQGALVTGQIAMTGEPTRYEAIAEVTGGPETPVITVTTLSPANSLATLRQVLPTLTIS